MSHVKPVERCSVALLVSGQYGGGQAWKGKRSQLASQTVWTRIEQNRVEQTRVVSKITIYLLYSALYLNSNLLEITDDVK